MISEQEKVDRFTVQIPDDHSYTRVQLDDGLYTVMLNPLARIIG